MQRSWSLSLLDLAERVERGRDADVLRTITVAELRGEAGSDLQRREQIRGYFERHRRLAAPAVFFAELLGIPRWRAQRLLGELEREGYLVRRGRTSSTAFRRANQAERRRKRR
ncbi:MAG: hypothetical protein HC927_04940 [Deltaproteobacteria bacterium]|nr:hypothetical protein [Deltaproteobacteria bacterium]